MLSFMLKEKVLAFLAGELTLQELEEWYVPRLPLLVTNLESVETELVSALDLGLAEMNDGIRTEDELRILLVETIRKWETKWADLPPASTTSTSESRTTSTKVSYGYQELTEHPVQW